LIKKSEIEPTKYDFILTHRELREKERRRERALTEKYSYLRAELEKIPIQEKTRWEMLWAVIRASYKIVRILYYIFKILTLFETLRGGKMTKDKLTTIIGAIIGAIITILTVQFGYTIPAEIAQVILGAIVAIVFWIWKPKE